MKSIPTIESVMTSHPYTVDVKDRVHEAQELMLKKKIRHLPVMSDGKPVSVLSERDVNLILAHYKEDVLDDTYTVGDFATKEAYIVDVNEPLDNVLAEMARRLIGSVIVVKEERIAGIFTTTDACRCFAEQLRQQFKQPSD